MKSYEDALQVNAEFVPAMNNLAWLYEGAFSLDNISAQLSTFYEPIRVELGENKQAIVACLFFCAPVFPLVPDIKT